MLPAKLKEILGLPRAYRWVVLFALLLSMPSLSIGLQADDFDMENVVRQDGPFGYISTTPIEPDARALNEMRNLGRYPWWVNETLRLSLYRPLSMFTHWLDFSLWPNAPWLMHLENCLIYALLVLVVALTYRSLGLTPFVQGLATLFYSINIAHAHSVGWIAGRNTLLYALFGFLAVLAHVRARTEGAKINALIAPLALTAALLSGEGGVAAFGFLIAYQIFIDNGTAMDRIVRLWPFVLVVIIWFSYYIYIGYGVHGSGWYLDVRHKRDAFFIGILTHGVIYLATQLTMPGAGLVTIHPSGIWIGFSLSVAVLLFLFWVVRPLVGRRRETHFFLLGTIFATIPLSTTPPQDRIVTIVAFGTCGWVAFFIAEVGALHHPTRVQKVLSQYMINLHGWFSALVFIPLLFGCLSLGARAEAIDQALPMRREQAVVLVNMPNDIALEFIPLMRNRRGVPNPKYVYALYAGASAIAVTRVDAKTLSIDVERGWLATRIERVRNDLSIPFVQGQRIELSDMVVEIQRVNRFNAPVSARFHFRTALEDSHRSFYVWWNNRPTMWTPPRIGETVRFSALPPM